MDPRRGALVFPECGVAKPRDLEQCDTSCALEATLPVGELLSSHYLSYGRGHSQLRDLPMHRWPLLEGNALKAMWVPVLSYPFGWWEGRSNKNDDSYDEFRLSTTGHSMWPDGKPLSAGKGIDGVIGTRTKWYNSCKLVQAVENLDSLVQQGYHLDNSVFYEVIKKCITERDLALGCHVHALAAKSGLESNAFLASHIICMYASHGRLKEAKRVFNNVPSPTRYMWASIISGHAQHGQPVQAIELYHEMVHESLATPDNHVFVAVLKACAIAGDLCSGRGVHADVLRGTEKPNIFVANCLVDMYAKCGSLEDARRVFDAMPYKDAVTWNAMIAGYARQEQYTDILALYTTIQQECIIVKNRATYFHLMAACAGLRALQQGKQLHAQIRQVGLEADLSFGNCLVDMYAKCGSLEDARAVFDNLATKDVVTWTAMMSGYVACGLGQEALALYARFKNEGKIRANHVTLVYALRACAQVGALSEGKQLHMEVRERGMEAHLGVGTCIVDMYAKCGSLEDARRVFDEMQTKNVVTWTAMIAGYGEHGFNQEALVLYRTMQQEGITPADVVTFVCLLRACASMEALCQGKQLHTEIAKRGLNADAAVNNCLVHMYVKCNSLEDARRVFDHMPIRDVVAWNIMIGGYARFGLMKEAFSLYASMQQVGSPSADGATYVCLLQVCGSLLALDRGKELHVQISKQGLDCSDPFVASALVHMYGKCGTMVDAHHVFSRLPRKDVVTWNALMAGHSRQGESELVFDLFERMIEDSGAQPNGTTFLILLTVCSQAGMVDEGQDLIDAMSRHYGVSPSMEHYNCLIDLLGRAGQLDRALQTVKMMPFQPDAVVWRILLSACQKWNSVELGRHAFQHLVSLDRSDAAAYMLMSNIYLAAHMQEENRKVQEMRSRAGARKEQGKSWWCSIDGVVHAFLVGDREYPHVHSELRHLTARMNQEGLNISSYGPQL